MFTDSISQWLRRKPKRPYQLFQIEPSLQCSLMCVMCPWTELRAQGGPMSWETFTHIAAHLHLAEEVDLTGGGEPTAHPRLVDMVRIVKQAGCQVGFSTNATNLTPQLSQALISLEMDWISFSIDAATAELYERVRRGAHFSTVTGNIAALRDQKAAGRRRTPRMMMVFVMMGGPQSDYENYRQLPAYVELAHALGVEQVIAKNLDVILKMGDDERRLFSHSGPPVTEVQATIAEAQARARELGISLRLYALQPQEQPICENNPLRNIFFNWEGQVSPCITLSYAEERFFDGQRVHEPCQRFGDINWESLEAIWNKPAYQTFRQAYEARLQVDRQRILDSVTQISLGQIPDEVPDMPPAPSGCRTCYYLYGV